MEQKIMDQLKEVMLEASLLMPEQISSNLAFETKDINSLVTEVDKNIEKFLVDKLQTIIPGAGFIAEEGTADVRGDVFNWVIDPLDGTTNFIHGIPAFCISVGLLKNSEIILGSIFEFGRNNYYTALKGGGSYLNGSRIRVSVTKEMNDSLLATGFPYYDFKYLEAYLGTFKEVMQHSRGIRRLGSAALDMAYVAAGKFDGFFEYSLHPWDVAAGIVIINEAGGKVTDFKGGENFLFGKELLASNGNIHGKLLSIIKDHFK
ncbi:MAG: inositol monophosphatase family protein [Vicingaceae bacterium]